MQKFLYILSALGLALAAALFFIPKASELPEVEEEAHEPFVPLTEEQIVASHIVTAKAEAGAVQKAISAPARILLDPDSVMHIAPKVSGIVLEAKKNVGDGVQEGEILAIFESHDMATAKSKYLDSLKKAKLAQENLKREKQLHEKQISAAQDYQNALAEAESARIELALAKQHLMTIGVKENEGEKLSHYELHSPTSGIIIEKALTKGELIEPSHEIYVIADPSRLVAETFLFPSDFALLEEGLELELEHPDGQKVAAQVVSISPSVDAVTGAIRLIATLPNKAGKWQQGAYVQASLKGKKTRVAIAVPKEALQEVEGELVLFVQKEGGFEVRPVKTGLCDNRCTEIIYGLSPGEIYVIQNSFILKAEHGKAEAEHMD